MSLNRESPQRLNKQDSGLRELSSRSFSKERLENNRSAIESAIGSLPATTPSLAGSIITKVTLGLALTAAIVWLTVPSVTQQDSDVQPPKVEGPDRQIQEFPALPTLNRSNPEPAPQAISNKTQKGSAKLENTPLPSQEDGKFKHMEKAPLRVSTRRSKSKKINPPPKATLGQEIQLFQKAKTHFENNNYPQAKAALNQLTQEFPKHQLGVELSLLNIRNHLALEENEAALRKMQDLLSDSSSKPQAQWYKLLGEIQQAGGRCGPALIAYSKALKMGLSARQEKEVRQAVGRCSKSQ